mmetsp:Transcript_67275/g.160449  ORF Transcript_67275/g.160449 Transcript_67275/m.160449 type:complete len:247 (-) Transcript_67275:265-1005(-)
MPRGAILAEDRQPELMTSGPAEHVLLAKRIVCPHPRCVDFAQKALELFHLLRGETVPKGHATHVWRLLLDVGQKGSSIHFLEGLLHVIAAGSKSCVHLSHLFLHTRDVLLQVLDLLWSNHHLRHDVRELVEETLARVDVQRGAHDVCRQHHGPLVDASQDNVAVKLLIPQGKLERGPGLALEEGLYQLTNAGGLAYRLGSKEYLPAVCILDNHGLWALLRSFPREVPLDVESRLLEACGSRGSDRG